MYSSPISCIGTVPVTVKKAQTDAGTEGVTDGSVNIGLCYHPFSSASQADAITTSLSSVKQSTPAFSP